MSEPTLASRPRRRRWWRRLLLALLLLVAAAAGYYFYTGYVADRELAEVVAQTDRDDPDWRLEQIEAKRKTYAPEDNAAETVLAAYRLLPPNWPPAPPPVFPEWVPPPPGDDGAVPDDFITPAGGNIAVLEDRLAGLPPEVQLDAALVRDLRAELARDGIKDALAATEPLSRQTGGRYTIDWGVNPPLAKVPGANVRPVAALLRMRALLQDQDGQADDALATIRRLVVAGRSLGDEPSLVAVLIRIYLHAIAAQATERALAQGQPSAEALAETQRLLAEDAAEPLLLYGLRGERAMFHRLVEGVKSGETTMDGSIPSSWRERADKIYVAYLARRSHPTFLRTFNEAVEIARRDPEEQAEGLRRLEDDIRREYPERNPADLLTVMLMPALVKIGEAFRRDRVSLRGAVVGLALERYRLKKGRWPNDLGELVPDYLPEVPLDPFDSREMRYRKLPDGVIVYSLGPDGQDDGGALNRTHPIAKGTDLGFRLWDVSTRRRSAAEALPPPEEFTP